MVRTIEHIELLRKILE